MRPKVLLLVLALVAAVVAGALMLKRPKGGSESAGDEAAQIGSSPAEAVVQPRPGAASATQRAVAATLAVEPGSTNSASTGSAEASGTTSAEQQQQIYVEKRSAELMDLAMNNDADSLHTILSELTNRDPEIRKAAVQAAIQYGSRDAIPALLDAALQTDDPHEKAELNDAAEFLKLPSLTEVLEAKRNAAKAAPHDSTGSHGNP